MLLCYFLSGDYMNDEMFRLTLIEIMNCNLLNNFVNDFFDYDFNDDDYVYIQYKVVNGNIVLNFFDNKNNNRFKAFIFTLNDIEDGSSTNYINVIKEYDKFLNGKVDKLCLLCSLLISKNTNEKRDIIEHLFTGKMKNIFSYYFL